jgi:hypothetical protein
MRSFNFILLKNLNPLILFLIVLISAGKIPYLDRIANPDANVILRYLDHLRGLPQYLNDLVNLKTIDVQPLRDFSLFFDLYVFEKMGLNLTIFQNILFWFLSCLILRSILAKIFPEIKIRTIFYITMLFSIYPLMINTVLWGIARKHILSFLFILICTNELLSKEKNQRSFLIMFFCYFCSLLSQPINILWPIWAGIYCFFYDKKNLKKISFIFFPVMIFFLIINYIYYEYSEVFKILYQTKSIEIERLPDVILALGHYSVQLVFPFCLNYIYPLGDERQLIGIGILVFGIYFLIKKYEDKKFLITWSFFGVLPMFIILRTPYLLMDTYLILPFVTLVILLMKLCEKSKWNINNKILSLPIIIFVFINISESSKWQSLESFTFNSFKNRPSCQEALKSALISLDKHGSIEDEVKNYIQSKDCISLIDKKKMTESQMHVFVRLNSLIIFYDDSIPYERKIKALKMMAKKSAYPIMVMAAVFAEKNKNDEIEKIFNPNTEAVKDKFEGEYDYLIATRIYPYCRSEKLQNCLLATTPYIADSKKRTWY